MAPVRLEFGHRSQNIDGRDTVVQNHVVGHMQGQASYGRKKLQTPGNGGHVIPDQTQHNKFAVYANQGNGLNQARSPAKNLRGAGAEMLQGYGSPRQYRDVCQHETGLQRERVINKRVDNASPRRNRPYGASPAAAAIRPPTGTGGFAANVSASLGSPERSLPKIPTESSVAPSACGLQRQPTPMPGTIAAAQMAMQPENRMRTAGFKPNVRGFNHAQKYHQDVSAPAFCAKKRVPGQPPAAIAQLADFGAGCSPGRSPAGIKTNIRGNNILNQCNRHRNTMGGVMPEGGAGYLQNGNRRRVVNPVWNASTESKPHNPGMHAKDNHPLSPRRLIAISPRQAQNIAQRKGAMMGIMSHQHVNQ